MQVLHLGFSYIKMTLHVHIVFRARSSLQGIQTIQMGLFETWVLQLRFFFHLNLQYPNLYLPLPTGFLGIHCNTYIHTYLYQLEFWGIIAVLALVLIFTNWDFGGLVTIPAFNTNIIIISCVCISHILCLLLGNKITFVPYQTSGVC